MPPLCILSLVRNGRRLVSTEVNFSGSKTLRAKEKSGSSEPLTKRQGREGILREGDAR